MFHCPKADTEADVGHVAVVMETFTPTAAATALSAECSRNKILQIMIIIIIIKNCLHVSTSAEKHGWRMKQRAAVTPRPDVFTSSAVFLPAPSRKPAVCFLFPAEQLTADSLMEPPTGVTF